MKLSDEDTGIVHRSTFSYTEYNLFCQSLTTFSVRIITFINKECTKFYVAGIFADLRGVVESSSISK